MTRPPATLRALLFDLDGVLIDSFQAWLRLANQAARAFGHPPIAEETFRKSFGQSSAADVEQFYPNRTAAEVDAFFEKHFREHLDAVIVNPDAYSVLERARRAGLLLACVTNTVQPLADEVLTISGLASRLDAIVGASPARRPKPAPDLVRAAADSLHVPLSEAILVGDSVFDVEAGRRAPAFTIGLGIQADASVSALAEIERWFPGSGGAGRGGLP